MWCTCKNRVVQKAKSDQSENFHLEKRKHHKGMTGPNVHGTTRLSDLRVPQFASLLTSGLLMMFLDVSFL